MPSIPVYNEPQVRQESLPGVRQQISGLNDNAFGPVTSSRYAAGAAEDLYAADQKKQEQVAAEDAFRAKSEFTNAYVDKQSELRQRQGKNAVGVKQELDTWMADNSKKYYDELKDPRAKQLFMHSAMQLHTGAKEWANGWETQQGEIAHDIEWKSNKEAQINLAANDSRPEIVSAAIAEIRRNNQYQAARKGWDEKVLEVENQNDIGALHKTILKNAMEQDSIGGVTGYLHQHGDSIDASMKATAEHWVHKKVIDEEATSFASGLLATGTSYEDALSGVREKYSGDDEDKYVSKVKEIYAEAEHIKNKQRKDNLDSVMSKVVAGGYVSLKDTDLESLDPSDQLHIMNAAKQERENIIENSSPYAKHTDPHHYFAALEAIQEGQITSEKDLNAYAPFVSSSDAKSLMEKIITQKTAPEKELKAIFAGREKLKSGPETWSEEKRNEYAAFSRYVGSKITETSRPQDVSAMADTWWLGGKGKNDEWFRNDPDTAGQSYMAHRNDFQIDSQPVNYRNAEANAVEILKAKGYPLTKTNIDKTVSALLGEK